MTIEKTLDGGAVTVESGTTTSISSDKKVKNTDVVASVEAGETTAVSFNTKNVKGSAIRIKGEGAGDVSFEGETRVKGTKIKKDGKIVVKDFEAGDTVKIDGESFTGAQIASSDLPAFLVIRGLS